MEFSRAYARDIDACFAFEADREQKLFVALLKVAIGSERAGKHHFGIGDLSPGSTHVKAAGLSEADDGVVWGCASIIHSFSQKIAKVTMT